MFDFFIPGVQSDKLTLYTGKCSKQSLEVICHIIILFFHYLFVVLCGSKLQDKQKISHLRQNMNLSSTKIFKDHLFNIRLLFLLKLFYPEFYE